jgi:hypothetical protein
MKRISLSGLFALVALLAMGCGSIIEGSGHVTAETRQVSNFSQVELSGMGDLYVTQGETETLRIEAEDNLIPYITTEVHGDTLEIGFRSDMPLNIWPTRPVKFYLTLKNVTGLQVRGSGNIYAERLAADQLQLAVSGSGNLAVEQLEVKTLTNTISGSGDLYVDGLKADSVQTTISGSGTCELAGETTGQSTRVSGSGDYLAFDLQSRAAALHVAGSGDVQAWVTEDLVINVVGSGDVAYYGTPKISPQIAGSGNVSGLGAH